MKIIALFLVLITSCNLKISGCDRTTPLRRNLVPRFTRLARDNGLGG